MTGRLDTVDMDVNFSVSFASEAEPRTMTVEAVGMAISVVTPGATNVSLLAPGGGIGFVSTPEIL